MFSARCTRGIVGTGRGGEQQEKNVAPALVYFGVHAVNNYRI